MKVRALWGIALIFSTSVLAQSPAYTGYWNKRTDKGSEFKCESAKSERGWWIFCGLRGGQLSKGSRLSTGARTKW